MLLGDASPWSVAGAAAAVALLWLGAWVLEWAWWTPRRLGRALRAQGLRGTRYRLFTGDVPENARLSREARLQPMPRGSHDITPRVQPMFCNVIKEHDAMDRGGQKEAHEEAPANIEHREEEHGTGEGDGKFEKEQQAATVGQGERQGAGELHLYPPWSKKGYGKGKSTGELQEGHQVADEAVMKPQRSNNKKRKKATAELCANPPAQTLGTLAVNNNKAPLSKKKRLNQNLHGHSKPPAPNLHSKSTPSIWANGKVMSSASRLCKQRGSINMHRKPKARRLKLNFDGSSKHNESRSAGIGDPSTLRRKPKAAHLKLNFDGSSKHDESRRASIGALGGVFRDHKGKFVLGYAGRIDKATSSVAELVALRRGLELALENGRLASGCGVTFRRMRYSCTSSKM